MWQAILAHIQKEWTQLKSAPLTFFILMSLGVFGGVEIENWHLSERLDTKEGEIHRYRVALGIDEASKGALVELNNQELALKAQSTVVKLRALADAFETRLGSIKQLQDSNKVSTEQATKDRQSIIQEVSQNFDRNLASDAENLRNELRRRLSPEAIAHVVQVPAMWTENGTVSVPVMALFKGTGFDAFYIQGLANEIEQMAKLLPNDPSGKP
jgi:hypothetical protein